MNISNFLLDRLEKITSQIEVITKNLKEKDKKPEKKTDKKDKK